MAQKATVSAQGFVPAAGVGTPIPLSNGRSAVVEPFFGRHIRQARKMALEAGYDFTFALIAQVAKIDGAGITPDELDDMPGNDVIKLQEAVQGN